MKVELQKGEGLEKGERYIVVDGVRWGQTIVEHHGMHGTTHMFRQEGGEVLFDRPESRYGQVKVHSMRTRRGRREEGWRPTEELVLEKARELVAECRLRHPANYRAEQERAAKALQERQAKAEAKEQREFEEYAERVILDSAGLNMDARVKALVAAMRWAQTR